MDMIHKNDDEGGGLRFKTNKEVFTFTLTNNTKYLPAIISLGSVTVVHPQLL